MSDVRGVVSDECSIRSVLDWYRRRITHDRFGSRFLPVPAALAGWVLAGPDDVSEADGTRPLGAVRDLLLDLIDTAGIGARERFVLCTRFGLTEYPAANPVRQLRHRLAVVRERGGDGLGDHRLSQLTTSAIRGLDRAIADLGLSRPGERSVFAGPVSDPVTASWFPVRVPELEQRVMFERAVNAARVFACVTGIDDEVLRVLDEIDAYHADAVSGAWPPGVGRRGRSRARALVSLALWDLIRDANAASTSLDPARTGRVREPASGPAVIAGSALGTFLAGDFSDEVVFAACEDALAVAAQDRVVAGISCDLLLGAYGRRSGLRLSDDAEATVLRTAVRVRAGDDDPTAVALAYRAFADRPWHWQTIDTLQAAVKVASAHGCYAVADELCDRADAILAERFSIPAGRELEVERTEYRLFTHHQRSGTMRRRLDEGAGQTDLRRALQEQDAAERDHERACELARSGLPGDAAKRWRYWRFFLEVRAAEIRLIVLERHVAGAGLVERLRNLDATLDRAAAIATAERFAGREFVPLIKVYLAKALAEGELPRAIELLHELHMLGWPLTRTVPAIVAISQPTRHRARAPRRLREAVDEVAAAQDEPSWTGRGAAGAGGWRRARARLIGR